MHKWLVYLLGVNLLILGHIQPAFSAWFFSKHGQLVYEQNGSVLGESTDVFSQNQVQKIFFALLETTEESFYQELRTADRDQIQNKLDILLQNVQVNRDAAGVVEVIVTDPEINARSVSSMQDNVVKTTVYEANGEETTFSYKIPDQLDISASASSSQSLRVSPIVEVQTGAEGVSIQVETSIGPTTLTQDLLEIEPLLETERIKLLSDANGEVVIAQGKIAAKTQQQLSLDTHTNQLIVQTGSGKSKVAFLPPAAVSGLLATQVIDQVHNVQELDAQIKGLMPQVEYVIVLDEYDQTLAYDISGVKQKKLLGVMPVSIPKHIRVSAETGEVLFIKKPLLDNVVEFLSI